MMAYRRLCITGFLSCRNITIIMMNECIYKCGYILLHVRFIIMQTIVNKCKYFLQSWVFLAALGNEDDGKVCIEKSGKWKAKQNSETLDHVLCEGKNPRIYLLVMIMWCKNSRNLQLLQQKCNKKPFCPMFDRSKNCDNILRVNVPAHETNVIQSKKKW